MDRGRASRFLCRAILIASMASFCLAWSGRLAAQVSADEALAALENRLVDARSVSFRFQIRAVGAVDATLTGRAVVGPGKTARIVADGSFAGSGAAIRLDADDQSIRGGNGEARFAKASPPAIAEGLLIGLTRMGLLHNLAVLSAGSPPDRTDGSVRDWVQYAEVALKSEEPVGDTATRRFSFTVVVDGQPSAIAELWVDTATGLPVRRLQVVSFPEGEMRVLEQYSDFVVEGGS